MPNSKKSKKQEKAGADLPSEQPIEPVMLPTIKTARQKRVIYMREATLKYPSLQGEIFALAAREDIPFAERDLSALFIAIMQKLCIENYSVDNKLHTGRYITGDGSVLLDLTMHDILQYGYGTNNPTGTLYATITSLIDFLHNTELRVLDGKGNGFFHYLITKVGGRYANGQKIMYRLRLHRIFYEAGKGFGRHNANVMKKLKELAGNKSIEIDRILLVILCNHDHSKPHSHRVDDIVALLPEALKNEFKKSRYKVMLRIFEALNRLVQAGEFSRWEMSNEGEIITVYYPSPKQKRSKLDQTAEK